VSSKLRVSRRKASCAVFKGLTVAYTPIFSRNRMHVIGSRSRKSITILSVMAAAVFGCQPAGAEDPTTSWESASQCTGPFWNDSYRPTPAIAGQTGAPAPDRRSDFHLEVVASGLVHPWSLAFLPDGQMLVTERPGRMRTISRDGKLSAPIKGLPPIKSFSADGLNDVLLDQNFSTNRILYFTYTAPLADGKLTATDAEYQQWANLPVGEHAKRPLGYPRLARARLAADLSRLEDITVILEGPNRRIAQSADGKLFLTTDTPVSMTKFTDEPQRLENAYGKVLRINPDGSVPSDNPWNGKRGARSDIFAIGMKDPEGAAFNPQTGQLWMVEHGPRGGDELIIVQRGRNYGFPLISYGRNYNGSLINGGKTAQAGLEQPLYFWTPSIAPSGLLFYTGQAFPEWRNSLFIGGLGSRRLVRLELKADRVMTEEVLLHDRCKRIRDVRQGPEGALYLLTEEEDGELWKMGPRHKD
jgi:glucose/arabinose dehydrogenase